MKYKRGIMNFINARTARKEGADGSFLLFLCFCLFVATHAATVTAAGA